MRDHPILFSAPMVRALLEGRKTQTRRLAMRRVKTGCDDDAPVYAPSPWQRVKPGDVLWVRETWAEVGSGDPALVVTRADYPECVPRHFENIPPATDIKWRVSIHMPRKFSRLTLAVTDVRVQRLQDISADDARDEGIERVWNSSLGDGYGRGDLWSHSAPGAFQKLWTSLHGPDSWDANPEVVRLTFAAHLQNIDVLKAASIAA